MDYVERQQVLEFRRRAANENATTAVDMYTQERLNERYRIAEIGVKEFWCESPPPPIRDPDDFTSEEDEDDKIRAEFGQGKLSGKHKKKSKKSKKKSKKKKKKKGSDTSSDSSVEEFDPEQGSDDDWIEVEPDEAALNAVKTSNEEAPIFMQDGFDQSAVGPGVPKFIHEQIKRQGVSKHKGDWLGEKTKVPNDFGGSLLRGEGEAMAEFVAAGVRIPRRGEIGVTAAEIEHYEKQGYVMSGTRHLRMEAVRMRKESQIYNADERRALSVMHRVEKEKQEYEVVQQFRSMINKKIGDRKSAINDRKRKEEKLRKHQEDSTETSSKKSKKSKKSKS